MNIKNFNKELIEKAKKIKLILMDVDGVLTNGEIIFDANGNELKIWNVKDGLGFSIVKRIPSINVGWITGRKSKNIKDRAKNLKIKYLFMGDLNKLTAYEKIKLDSKLKDNEIAYIGDDLVDIPLLKKSGLSFCPNDATKEVKDISNIIININGGKGIFRFVLEFILKSQNKFKNIEDIFLN